MILILAKLESRHRTRRFRCEITDGLSKTFAFEQSYHLYNPPYYSLE